MSRLEKLQYKSLREKAAKRTCLRCGKLFSSRDPGHRICNPCKGPKCRRDRYRDLCDDYQHYTGGRWK